MDCHLALKHTVQATQSHDSSLRKVNKLHDKLAQGKDGKSVEQSTNDRPELSVKAAVKLLMAYELAVKSCRSLQESIEHSLEKVRAPVDDSEPVPIEVEPPKEFAKKSAEPVSTTEDWPSEPIFAPTEPALERPMSGTETFFPVGTLVAVLCRVDDESEFDEWMLATVRGYRMEDNLYEVDDCELIEPAEGEPGEPYISQNGQGKRRVAPLAKIIRLPQSDEEAGSVEECKSKAKVLALYPGTTCLYPAHVVSPPSKRKKHNDYLLKFNDDEVPSRACAAKYVVEMPDFIS